MLKLRSPVVRVARPESEGRRRSEDADSARAFTSTGIRTLYIGVVCLVVFLLYVSVTRPQHWSVDTTSLGLVGILCVLPVIDRLRKLKWGGIEVELDQLLNEVAQLRRESAATGAEIAEERSDDADPDDDVLDGTSTQASVPIDQIVWVDDNPGNNDPYVTELEKRFRVLLATSTKGGMELVGQSPGNTLVITDAVRVEDGSTNYRAGRDLLRLLRSTHPAVPVIVFASVATVEQHDLVFLNAGARAATASFAELAEEVTTLARQRFRAAVVDALSEASPHDLQRDRMGWFVTTQATRLRVEARDWRRKPTTAAVTKVWARARRVLEEGTAEEVLVVVPMNKVTAAQLSDAPNGLSVVSLTELRTRLS